MMEKTHPSPRRKHAPNPVTGPKWRAWGICSAGARPQLPGQTADRTEEANRPAYPPRSNVPFVLGIAPA